MDSNQCQDHTNIDGRDASGCTHSSHSKLPPRSEHSHDSSSHHETAHPSLCSTLPQNSQEQPAAQSCLLLADTQLSASSSPSALYPSAPSSECGSTIGIVTRYKWDQNPQKDGRLSSDSDSDSDYESRAGMEEETEGGLVCGGGIGLRDEH